MLTPPRWRKLLISISLPPSGDVWENNSAALTLHKENVRWGAKHSPCQRLVDICGNFVFAIIHDTSFFQNSKSENTYSFVVVKLQFQTTPV
jgi:hypothetical protein